MVRTKAGFIETDAEFREAFNLMDTDRDGYIDSKDLARAFEASGDPISMHVAEEMIRCVGMNLERCVNFQDFRRMMESREADPADLGDTCV